MEHLGEGFKSLGSDGLLPIGKTVDDAAGIEKVADADGTVEVVVHRLVTLFLEFLCIFDADGGLLSHRFDAFELLDSIHQAVETLLGSLQGIVAEIDGRTVVGLEEEEAAREKRRIEEEKAVEEKKRQEELKAQMARAAEDEKLEAERSIALKTQRDQMAKDAARHYSFEKEE